MTDGALGKPPALRRHPRTRKKPTTSRVDRTVASNDSKGIGAIAGTGDARVVIVTDDPAWRQKLSRALRAEAIPLVARVGKLVRALELCAGDPEIIAILGGGTSNAPAAVRELKRMVPETRIILVAEGNGNGTTRTMRAALKAQVEAVVHLEHLETALGPTVRAVAAGQIVFPRSERRRLELPVLSHREKQVLRLAVNGFTNDEIGHKLFLATSTVKSHLTSAFAKLSVRSRSEAAALIFDPDEPAGRAVLAGIADEPEAVEWN
jgi:DNA-binding NarL/FixJ family response regulator